MSYNENGYNNCHVIAYNQTGNENCHVIECNQTGGEKCHVMNYNQSGGKNCHVMTNGIATAPPTDVFQLKKQENCLPNFADVGLPCNQNQFYINRKRAAFSVFDSSCANSDPLQNSIPTHAVCRQTLQQLDETNDVAGPFNRPTSVSKSRLNFYVLVAAKDLTITIGIFKYWCE